jgi:creatinine amidohydrolase
MINLKVLLHEMNWKEAKRYFAENDLAILPVGSNEQHGPPNPLGTDHLIAKGIAEEVARRTGVACLQVIPFGVSPHHKQFWGTISVSPKSLKKYVKDVCLSLKYYGVHKIVIVNGHGGNLAVLAEMARELREQEAIFLSIFQWWPASAKLLPGLFEDEERRHAAAEETSMNMVLNPQLVRVEEAVDEKVEKHKLFAEGVTLPLSTVDETASGSFGKTSTASLTKGKKDFESVVKELVRHIELLKQAKMKDLIDKPKV